MDTLIRNIEAKLKTQNAKKIFLQAPEGLKTRVLDIAESLEKTGFEVIIGCDPTYGACDLRDNEALSLGCDLLLHIGHSDFGVKSHLPVIYEPYEMEFDPLPLLKKHLPSLSPFQSISLLTTIQFEKILKPAQQFLEQQGKKILFVKQIRNQKEGLLLGCDWTAALPLKEQVDCFLYIGSGKFHPLGLARMVSKPVLWLDIETGELKDLTKEKQRLEKVKAFHLEQAKESQRFGILLSVKEGQFFLKKAEELKKMLREKGKNAYLLVMDEISPAKIAGMKLEVLVNCACPRIDEDFSLFKKPILNPEDVYKI